MPQVVDAVSVPVVAAGGIADGRGLAAALVLGAGAAQIGTAFIALPGERRPAVLPRGAAAAPTRSAPRSRVHLSGRPARVLRNRVHRGDPGPLAYPAQMSLTAALRDAGPDPADFFPLFAGQGALLARAAPAAEVVASLVAEAEQTLARD